MQLFIRLKLFRILNETQTSATLRQPQNLSQPPWESLLLPKTTTLLQLTALIFETLKMSFLQLCAFSQML
jgi:hypothetical protein